MHHSSYQTAIVVSSTHLGTELLVHNEHTSARQTGKNGYHKFVTEQFTKVLVSFSNDLHQIICVTIYQYLYFTKYKLFEMITHVLYQIIFVDFAHNIRSIIAIGQVKQEN